MTFGPLCNRFCLVTLVLCFSGNFSTAKSQQPADANVPATVEVAAKVIDLSALAMVGKEPSANHLTLASQSYTTQSSVADAATEIIKTLASQGWKEAAGTAVSEAYASATLSKDRFVLSVAVMPASEAGRVAVNLTNHGNVDLKQVPLPRGSEVVFVSPIMRLYRSSMPVAQAREYCLASLKEIGWQPYGEVGDSISMKFNAVKLSLNLMQAAGFDGQTAIQISSEQMSSDLLLMPDAVAVQHNDSLATLRFDSSKSQDEVADFYRAELVNSGWKATTDAPVKIDFRNHWIFRNPAGSMLELQLQSVDELTRVALKYSSAEAVHQQSQRASELADAKQKQLQMSQVVPNIELKLPATLEIAKKTDNEIQFTVAAGMARNFAKTLTAALQADQWKATVNVADNLVGSIDYEKGDHHLQFSYTDTGFLAPEVTLTLFGKGKLVVVESK